MSDKILTLEVQLVDAFRLKSLDVQRFVIILPQGFAPPPQKKYILKLNKNKDRYEILGVVNVIERKQVPLRRVMDMHWGMHIGPGYMEEYIEKANVIYKTELTPESMVELIIVE